MIKKIPQPQSPWEWWLLLRDSLKDVGWSQLFTDQCVFKRSCVSGDEFLADYVDDLIILSPTPSMTKCKLELLHLIESKDMGELTYALGIRVTRDRSGRKVKLDQAHLINSYLDRFAISGFASTPGYWKSPSNMPDMVQLSQQELQCRVGALLHVGLHTRPDRNDDFKANLEEREGSIILYDFKNRVNFNDNANAFGLLKHLPARMMKYNIHVSRQAVQIYLIIHACPL